MIIEWFTDETLPQDILKKMEKAASRCLVYEGISLPCSVTVRLCDDDAIERINSEYRGIRKSTDVLSFPTVSYPSGSTAGHCENLLKRDGKTEDSLRLFRPLLVRQSFGAQTSLILILCHT